MYKHARKSLLNPMLLIGIICLTLLPGCGDSNMFESLADDQTSEAQVSTALDSINSGDYNSAITILEGMDTTDPEVKKYLASAYIGSTGFDTLKLIETMGKDADDDTSSTDGGIFSTVNDLLDFEGGVIDTDSLASKIETADKALKLLVPDMSDLDSLSDQDKFQAGLYASVQTIYVLENILEGNDPEALTDPSYTGTDTIEDLVTQNFLANKDDLTRSLDLVVMASDSLIDEFADPADTNDVQESLDEFLVEIGYLDNEIDRNVVAITSDKLSSYITDQSI